MESLDDRQREQLVNHGYFDVRGGGRRRFHQWLCDVLRLRLRRRTYRIFRGVYSAEVMQYCVHVRSDHPIWDDLLTLKFWIEGSEGDFREIANYYPHLRYLEG